MAASTAPAAKQKILDLLAARPTLAAMVTANELKIRWAAPTEEADYRRDVIWLGDVEQTEEHIALGGMRKDEDYTIQLWCQSYRVGDDPKATEEACWALREEAAAAIRTDVTLGGILTSPGYIEIQSTNVTTRPAEKGWLVKAEASLLCHARI